MDKRRVIKFFPKSEDTAGEVGKLISIMRQDGYELLSFTLMPSAEATLVFEQSGAAEAKAASQNESAAGAKQFSLCGNA